MVVVDLLVSNYAVVFENFLFVFSLCLDVGVVIDLPCLPMFWDLVDLALTAMLKEDACVREGWPSIYISRKHGLVASWKTLLFHIKLIY